MKTPAMMAAVALLATLPGTAVSQVPPELLGLGNSTREALDTAALQQPSEGGWTQLSGGDGNGLGCVVTFFDGGSAVGDTFGLVGPTTPDLAEKGIGLVIFSGRRIPRAAQDGVLEPITILSNAAPNNVRAMHFGKSEMNSFMVPVRISEMLVAENPEESIAIQYKGEEIYRVNITEYNNGRVKLRDCMKE